MTSPLKETFNAFVFEHRRGLVGVPGFLALLVLWMNLQIIPFDMNSQDTMLACAVAGTLLILIGVIIRLWSGLYIAGHKNNALVTRGPYSVIRNPLYAGNMVSALGVMLMTRSPAATLVVMIGLSIIYDSTIAHEEKKLLKLFGNDYIDYLRTTSRLIPSWKALRAVLCGTMSDDRITYRNLPRELKRGGIFIATGLLVLLGTGAVH